MDNPDAPPPGTGGAASADPLGLLRAVGDLVNPGHVARELPWLAGELMKIAVGGGVPFADRDTRFADVTWQANPFFRLLGQGYRLFEELIGRLADAAPGPWERQARTRYLANIAAAALSPTNFLPTNPAAIKRAFETGGQSVLRGAQHMVRDIARDGMPLMASQERFPVGARLGCTPGAVVYRDEVFELLQYAPRAAQVRRRPLLMVPPQLNRHYVLDLAPGRSMVEFAVGQGIQTFMIVWRNPRSDLGHGRWGVDDYLAAQVRASEVVQQITRSETVNWLGLCAGGITTALMLGYLAARGAPVGSATFLVTMLESTSPNVVGMMDTAAARRLLDRAATAGRVLPAATVRANFAWLRPNDLVFNYLVSGWLLGEDPPAFDVLAWNNDATALSARFALESTELLAAGKAAKPGGLTVLGVPVDLTKVDCDSFHVAGYTDHLTPWRACYSSTQLLGGDKEFVVVKSGHIQSFVNPAGSARYDYWAGPPASPDPDAWLATVTLHSGSWWPHWADWLAARSGQERQPRTTLGSRKHPPLGPAPGTYVHE